MGLLSLIGCADESNLRQPTELEPLASGDYLEVNWLKAVGPGVGEQYLFLQPLVLDDRLVMVGRDGQLSLIDRLDGEQETVLELETPVSAGVGGNRDLWLVATEDAHVVAIDAKQRQVRWRVRVPSEVLARPVLHGDNVLVRTVDGKITSIDRETGKLRWQYERIIPDLTLRGSGELVLSRQHIIAGLADGRVIALDPDTGDVLWDVVLAVPGGSSEIQRLVDVDGRAALYGRILYIAGYQGRIAAIDVTRGQFLWARDFSSHTGIDVDDKVVYVTDDDGDIQALDRYNGATIWKQVKLGYRKVTAPAIVGDYLAVGDFEGYVHLLSKYDGRLLARYQLGQFDATGWERATGIILPPQGFDDNRLLVVTRGGMAYDLVLRHHEAEDRF